MRDGHLRLRDLADLRDGVLPAARRTAAEAHLASGCADCAARRDGLFRAVAALRGGALPAPPRDAVRAAKRLFVSAKWAAFLGRAVDVVARLASPPHGAPAFALRADGPRRLLFAADGLEIDVEVDESGGRATLTGRVLRADGGEPARCRVTLWRDGRPAGLGADGAFFSFDGLPDAAWALTGEIDGRTFRTPPVVTGGEVLP